MFANSSPMKPPIFSLSRSLWTLSIAVLLAGGTQHAHGATYVWVGGGGNANWSTTGNWFTDNGTAPIGPDVAATTPPANPTAPTGTVTKTTPTDAVDTIYLRGATQNSATVDAAVGTPWYIESLIMDSAAAFTLSGSRLLIRPTNPGGTHDGRYFLINGSASTKTIGNDIKVLPAFTSNTDGSGINVGSGAMILNGALDVQGLSGIRTLGGSGSVTINGVISGTHGGWAINGGSTMILNNAANTFTGGMTVWNGVLKLGATGVLGGGTTISMSNPTNSTFKSTVLTTSASTFTQAISIAPAYVFDTVTTRATTDFATLGSEGTGITNFNGKITTGTAATVDVDPTVAVNNVVMGRARALTFTADAGGRVNFAGGIERGAGATGNFDTVTKTGAGIVAVGGATNNWQGQTNVNSGAFLVNGTVQAPTDRATSMVIVSSNATLGGSGTLNRDVLLAGGSTFTPGDMSGATTSSLVGTFTVGGYLEFENSGNFLNFDLGTTSDKVVVNGDLILTGTLNIQNSGGFGAGTYELFDYSGNLTYTPLIMGTSNPVGYDYNISTTGTGGSVFLVVTTTVPEPGRAVLLMLGCASLVMRRKRKNASPSLS